MCIAVILLSISLKTSRSMRSALNYALSPLVKGVGAIYMKARSFKGSFADRKNLMRENKDLKVKLDSANNELNGLREKALENERLVKLLDFKRKEEYDVIPARVIGREPSSWFESVFIDRGTAHGVTADMPVVTSQGLAGKIVEASGGVSKVLLIMDKNSKVGAMVQNSRDYGILEGTSSSICRLNYLSRNAVAGVNDQVISSGLGAVYPKGLVIGKVIKSGADTYGLYKYAEVVPACDFSKLEEVLVLRPRQKPVQAPPEKKVKKKALSK